VIRLTVRHVFDFGADRALVGDDLVRPASWDALRTRTSGPFAIARDRAELERMADEHPEVGERARAIDRVLDSRGVATLASYGVGGGLAEAWLRRLRPERRLLLTDYAPETVERLRELFPNVDVRRHDLLRDPPLAADAHLFHRIDTELANTDWRGVFGRFAEEMVVVVATEVADVRRVVAEVRHRLQNRHLTRAGWLRNRAAFEALFRPTHDAQPATFGDLEGWVLEPRSAAGRL
jgi:hypothetical protein